MRLIDADALNIDREHFDTYADYSHAFDMIDNAPTIDAVPVRSKYQNFAKCHYCRKDLCGREEREMTEVEAQIITDTFNRFPDPVCDYMTEHGTWCETHCDSPTWKPECLLRYVKLRKKDAVDKDQKR